MIITCDACNVRFNLDESLLKPTGTNLRCSKCQHVFTAYPQPVAEEPEVQAEPVPALDEEAVPEADGATAEVETGQVEAGSEAISGADDADAGFEFKKTSELDLSELDQMISGDVAQEEVSEPSEAVETADDEGGDAEDLDISLFDEEPDEAGDTVPTENIDPEAGLAEGTDLNDDLEDMDLDLDLDMDDAPAEETDLAAEPTDDTDIDDALDELDFDLGLDDTPAEETDLAAEPTDDTDIDDALDELDFDLGLDDAPAEGTDLAAEPSDDTDIDDDMEEMDLDLDLDLDEPAAEPAEEAAADDDLGEMDLDLDLDLDEPAAEPAEEAAADDNLGDMDLDLDFDMDEPAEEPSAAEPVDIGGDLEGELDLSELESALDEVEDSDDMAQTFDDSQELDLDLDLDSEPDTEPAEDIDHTETGEEFDFSDLEDMLEDEETVEPAEEASDELDLEETILREEEPDLDIFDIGDGGTAEATQTDLEFGMESETAEDQEEATMVMDPDEQLAAVEAAYAQTMEIPSDTDEKAADTPPAAPPRKPAPKKKGGKLGGSLIAVLVLALIAAGGYFGMDYMGIRIPYVSDLINPLPPDPGNLNISTQDINSIFVGNEKLGKLFVISGKIKNSYAKDRRSVKIIGKLFAPGKKVLATKTVYAGNVISGPDLASMDLPGINQRLNKQNLSVASGQLLPFMVVFPNLPDNLAEFTIEVAGSSE